MSRVAAIAVWLLALVAVAGLWRLVADLTDRPILPSRPVLSAPHPAPRVQTSVGDPFPWIATEGSGWNVVHQLSAHHVLVVEVETARIAEAAAIAQQLAEPVKDRYSEIMVYFFRPGQRGGVPAARVQWTPRRGYDVTEYEKK